MRAPSLLLIGQQETLYDPVAALERARKLVPHLEGELIPRASHDMTMGQHELVDRRILGFLKNSATVVRPAGSQKAMMPVPSLVQNAALRA